MRKIKDRTGEVHTTNNFGKIKIIEYKGNTKVSVKFEDGTIVKNVYYESIKKGMVKNPNSPNVYNKGFIGQGEYNYKNSKHIYQCWVTIFQRCYSGDFENYNDCNIDKSWYSFQNFAKWYDNNYVKDWQLDKDILNKGNKIYSEKTCCFVPKSINVAFTNSKKVRGKYPIGVSIQKGVFYAHININSDLKHLGIFNTAEEAFKTYKKEKEKYLKSLADKYKDQLKKEVYKAIINYKIEITD